MNVADRVVRPALMIAVVCPCAATVGPAAAQDETVASLPWTFGQTAGIRAQVRGAPTLEGDIWVIEDLVLDEPVRLTRFVSQGTVNPASFAGRVEDVIVQIRDGMPPEGNIVLQSVPGAGEYLPGTLGNGRFQSDFGEQELAPGSYIIMWAAVLKETTALSIMWHQPGEHAVGGGEPDNGFYWLPATGEIREVPLELGGGGRSGMNFVLRGIVNACAADCDGDGELSFFDFLCFQNLFAAGDPAADCDADGELSFFDFLCFQNEFAAGCP